MAMNLVSMHPTRWNEIGAALGSGLVAALVGSLFAATGSVIAATPGGLVGATILGAVVGGAIGRWQGAAAGGLAGWLLALASSVAGASSLSVLLTMFLFAASGSAAWWVAVERCRSLGLRELNPLPAAGPRGRHGVVQ